MFFSASRLARQLVDVDLEVGKAGNFKSCSRWIHTLRMRQSIQWSNFNSSSSAPTVKKSQLSPIISAKSYVGPHQTQLSHFRGEISDLNLLGKFHPEYSTRVNTPRIEEHRIEQSLSIPLSHLRARLFLPCTCMWRVRVCNATNNFGEIQTLRAGFGSMTRGRHELWK